MSKKIYFVVHDFSSTATGGVNRVVSETANELANDQKYDVNILSLGRLNGLAYPLCHKVKIHSLNMKKHSTSQYKGFIKILWLLIALKNILKFYNKEHQPSVWNITSPPLIVLFSLIKKSKNFFLYCEHTSPLGKHNNFLKNKIRSLILNTGDKTISLNKKDDAYYKSINVDSKLIYNGCKRPENLNLSKDKNIIFVGRFSYEKNPLEALDIFYKSEIWKSGYKLKFFGDGIYIKDIILVSQNMKIENYVEIISSEKDPSKIYENAAALIMTSHYEGLPMVLIESISRGLPCLSYNCPQGPAEIIIDGVNGFLIENQNKNDFIKKLSSLDYEKLSREKITSTFYKFDISNVIKDWKKMFENYF